MRNAECEVAVTIANGGPPLLRPRKRNCQRRWQIGPIPALAEIAVIARKLAEISLQQDITAQRRLDRRLLRMRRRHGNPALPIAYQFHGLRKSDSGRRKLPLNAIAQRIGSPL